jgi:hypothetical protein
VSYFFDKRFKVGLIAGAGLFVILNIASYQIALKRYEELQSFSPFGPGGFDWGFPFVWGRQYITPLDDGALNIAFCLALCVAVGTVFKFLRR